MTQPSGSVVGGMLLIAGSCVGAGMLALPILTGIAGFLPAVLMFVIAWLFMTFTGLLLVEVNGWFGPKTHYISMTQRFLGKFGKITSWVLYLFLFYALLVAYVSGSGGLVSSALGSSFPDWIGSLFFVILFGFVVYMGTKKVDLWNRYLMAGKILCYIGLVFLGFKFVNPHLLMRTNAPYAIIALPLLVTSFGFHNMIPSITTYMNGDLRKVRQTIWGGSTFALIIYLIWEVVVLGIVPLEGAGGIIDSLKQDKEASQAIAGILGVSWVSSFAQGLAFFAILTSFLAQSLSLVHFLADGFKVKSEGTKENPWLCLATLAPPLVLSIIYPELFFKALSFAGGFCAVILFGIFPVWMAWKGRKQNLPSSYQIFGGGKLLLIILFISLFILSFQIATMFGMHFEPV